MVWTLKTQDLLGREVAQIMFRLLSRVYRKGDGINPDATGILCYLFDRLDPSKRSPEGWEKSLSATGVEFPEIPDNPTPGQIVDIALRAQKFALGFGKASNAGEIKIEFEFNGSGDGAGIRLYAYELTRLYVPGNPNPVIVLVHAWSIGTPHATLEICTSPAACRCESVTAVVDSWISHCKGEWIKS